ncbi:MAG: SIMPL domain-containing protein [Deltaproteobacteria bacterium]|nr:SIMPL domain-containing protein [Deltaproteobacteria bacterium]
MSRIKIVVSIVLSALMFFIGEGYVNAQEKASSHSEVKLVKRTDRTEVQLSQQAERMEARNRISVKLKVDARGKNARQIQLAINKQMSTAIKKAESIPSITVETSSYSVSRPYDSQNEKETDRWRGSQTLSLTSDDFEEVLNLAGELQNDGLVMSEMRFFVAPETLKAAQDELTTAALQALKERTNHVAKDLGLKIERYKTITIGNASEEYGDTNRKSGKSVATVAAKRSPPAVAAGHALITLQVSAVVIMSE